MTEERIHEPVLVTAVSAALRPDPADVILDLTVGAGGHAAVLLDAQGKSGRLIGADRDPAILVRAREVLARFGNRVHLRVAVSEDVERVLDEAGEEMASVVLMDLGVSSLQLDDGKRGFSFLSDGPLDMRMGPSSPVTAAEWLASVGEEELARVLLDYGEERQAARIAAHVCATRRSRPIRSTGDLAERVVEATRGAGRRGVHPATLAFQAIRIRINDELGVLARTIPKVIRRLRPGGRFGVISFHSLEDRIVKNAFREAVARGELADASRRPVQPGMAEVARNPRSRSARLRVGTRSKEEVR